MFGLQKYIRRLSHAGFFGFCLLAGFTAQPQSAPVLLTNASDILSLPSEHPFGSPVRIRGVVTAARPESEWGGRFFIQDHTGGIFVEHIGTNPPAPGDLLEIEGKTHPGGFAPIITSPHWKHLGRESLPAAKPVAIEQLMAGVEDSQRVEITGIIRAYRPVNGLVFEVVSGGYRLDVTTPPLKDLDPESLIGATVRVRGTAATFYSGKLRNLITVTLHVPIPEDFIVESAEPGDPFTAPVIALNRIGQYRHNARLGQRVHVRGTVTLQRPGQDLFIQDSTGGLQIKSRSPKLVSPGDLVEAVGFPSFEQYLPVLEDAIFREVDAPCQAPIATPLNFVEMQGGHRHADLVTVQARVLERSERSVINANRERAGMRTVLTLQNADFVFTVEGPVSRKIESDLAAPVGSLVEVTGVCLTKIAEDGKLLALQILLPTPANIRLLKQPTWWTTQRLLMGLGCLCAVLIVAVSWNLMISRKNVILSGLVREKEQAQIGLQHANDRLEERVRERSEQLTIQINARKEAELQFKAVLHERSRLARELHDTLEQTLTGIALQMDTAARFATTEPARAKHHLQLARNLVEQSQTDVRCSVWDLRSRSPEQIDLAGLLVKISHQLVDDTGIEVRVKALGRVRPLPDLIEENLLRVSQEALTNVIKHSKATEASITLDYGPKNVMLTIADNGAGFEVSTQAGPREGHFGLLGMTERANRLGGHVSVASTPGKGAIIQVTLPIPAPAAETLPAPNSPVQAPS